MQEQIDFFFFVITPDPFNVLGVAGTVSIWKSFKNFFHLIFACLL